MSTHQQTSATHEAAQQSDPDTAEAFAGRLVGILNDAAIALLISIGHQTGLFDILAGLPLSTSGQIAEAAELDERYVREWLGGMTAARIILYDPAAKSYQLPRAHAAALTRAAGPDNLALTMQDIAMMGEVEQKIIERFRHGGGLSYSEYARFHRNMAEASAPLYDAALLEAILPLAPELPGRLAAGIDVADIGCGSGHAINLMAGAFPASRFTGYDFSEAAIAAARAESRAMGLDNAVFEVRDVANLDVEAGFDVLTAFDAIHDQAHPARVLRGIRRALRPEGVFLMADIKASSRLEENIDLPWASYLYAVSTFHCMSVSLGLGGDGLGTVWGTQLALSMITQAGFGKVEPREIDSDPFNAYYVARR